MRAIKCATRAFRHLLTSHCAALTSIIPQGPALHPTRSGVAGGPARSGNSNSGSRARDIYQRYEFAFPASSFSASSQGGDRFSGYVTKRKPGKVEKRKQEKKRQDKKASAVIPETLAASDIREKASATEEPSSSDKDAPEGNQTAVSTLSSSQEGKTSRDSQEAAQDEKAEADQSPSPEEQKYATEFQRIAGEPP